MTYETADRPDGDAAGRFIQYVEKAVQEETTTVRNCPDDGSGHKTLNASTYSLATLGAAVEKLCPGLDLLPREKVRESMRDAISGWTYRESDDEAKKRDTIDRAIRDGWAKPRDLDELIAKVTYQSPTEPQADLSAVVPINEIPHGLPPGEPGHEPDLTFHALADMAAEVDAMGEPAFLFEPVVVAGDYGVMSAEDKAGKTWGGLDAAVSAASGLSWMGKFPCRCPGTVLVFHGEGGRRKVVRRIRAIAVSKGLSREQADALPIVVCPRAPKLGDVNHRILIRQAVEKHRPVLVVLDPLYLAAGGANGADLYAMGEVLGYIQRICQDAKATLLVSHHWNKTGTGKGHNRSSGVGPGAWGRFLISVGVHSSRTDEATKETVVILSWMFKGDEIPDTEIGFIRRVRAVDPLKLSSDLIYSIATTDITTEVADRGGGRLSPSEQKILEVLRDAAPGTLTNKTIVDAIVEKYSHGLTRPTVSKALGRLADLGSVTDFGEADPYGTKVWGVPREEQT